MLSRFIPVRAAFMGATLWLLLPRLATKAEDSLSYKFQTWQEDNGRIRVDAHYAQAETTLPTETKLKLVGLIDTIAGATPSGQPADGPEGQVPLSNLTDRREAAHLEVTHPFNRVTVTGGFATSDESDYISDVWSLNTVTDFNQKNTSLLLGYARANDDITALPLPAPRKKKANDFIVGVNQLLGPATSLTANLTFSRTEGYISDPYKIVERETEILPGLSIDLTFPENRPSEKDKWIVFLGLNHKVEPLNGAVEATYRWLDDTFGTTSHTIELAWFQRFSDRLVVRPAVRFYDQSAADFYRLTLTGTNIVPETVATGAAPYYSSDYRLSKMRTWMIGVKASWDVAPWFAIDATLERYLMRGRDGVTPRSAYADANVITIGARIWR